MHAQHLFLRCYTQQEIADDVGVSQKEADRTLASFSQYGESSILTKTQRAAAEHATDFDVPIYNIWKQQTKSEGSSTLPEVAPRGRARVATARNPAPLLLVIPNHLAGEWRLGEALAAMEKHNGDPRLHDETGGRPTLSDLGITKTQSHRCQVIHRKRFHRMPRNEHRRCNWCLDTLAAGGR